VVAGAVLLFSPRVSALNPLLNISQYAHTAWTVREGFSPGKVLSITQTVDGFIWLGTDAGLLRFDGVRTVPLQVSPDQHLPAKKITALLATPDGALWIGTVKGLASWKGGKLRIYPDFAGLPIMALHEDREGAVWVGATTEPPAGKLCAIHNDAVNCYGKDGALENGAMGIHEDSKKRLWVGGVDGFLRWHPGASRFYSLAGEARVISEPDVIEHFAEESDGSLLIQHFAEESDGSLLIPLRGRVARFVDGTLKGGYLYPRSARQFLGESILRDRDGGLWVGTMAHGLVHIRQGGTDNFSESEGLSGNLVSAVFEDREGSVWVGTNNGFDRFRAYAVATFGEREGISVGDAHAAAAQDGSLWWWNADRRLSRWDRGRGGHGRVQEVSVLGLSQHDSYCSTRFAYCYQAFLFQDLDGRMWINTGSGVVGQLRSGRFVPMDAPGGLVYAIAMASDSKGNLWISNHHGGLLHLFRGKLVRQIPQDALGRTDFVSALTADQSDGGVWLGFSKGGIAYLRDGQIRTSYTAADGLGGGRVNDVRLDHAGTLWIATDNGLSRLKDARVATFSTKNGLPCDRIGWLVEADDHALWLHAACGLVRIAPADIDAWAAERTGPERAIQPLVLDDHDGVPPLAELGDFPQPKGSISADGTIWFVSADGLRTFDPHHLGLNTLPAPVHIEQLTYDGKPFDVGQALALPPRVRDLTIAYTALSYVAPERVRFRYKLEGFDPEWHSVGNRRQAYYTNLPPRAYRFRVMASNDNGVWNDVGASLDFSIAPAYYQTARFRAGIVVAVLALVWAMHKLRVRQLAHQFDARLHERVSERTRIARELHDTLLQSFHGVMFRFQAAANVLPERPLDAKQRLETALKQGQHAIREGRDAVQGLRDSTVATNDLAVALRALGEELAASEGNGADGRTATVSVAIQGTPEALRPIIRDDIYRIGSEALRNAFRHARARRIEMEIRYDASRFQLRVRDDGHGIDTGTLEAHRAGHFGLPGMRERAERIGGHVEVWSKAGMGTEVALTIPGATVYASPRTRRPFWSLAGRPQADL
jgi:signal transduction histidine kinase/ligand-binding sensor domain-containing protein